MRKFFKSVSRIIRRPKSSRIEGLKAFDEFAEIMGVTLMLVTHYTFFFMRKTFITK